MVLNVCCHSVLIPSIGFLAMPFSGGEVSFSSYFGEPDHVTCCGQWCVETGLLFMWAAPRGIMHLHHCSSPRCPSIPRQSCCFILDSRKKGKKDTQRQEPRLIHSTWILWAGNQPWLLNPLTSEMLMLFLLQHNLAKANKYSRNINSTTLTKKNILTIYIRSLKISWHYWLKDSLTWLYVSRGSQQYNPWCWKLEASQMTKIRRILNKSW